ncbi:hypothetical protein CTAYLR_001294 [Chrysophaeum taylorii]|uniref:PWWP domain-containing protein n=1 Tax=Chrysophaeum taylorii TaxID=2483200 RepID=A0AAD7UE41_9STRA|nr:hypothetical protein CTAYLR_001294 [Chrysophaeum taylorii]
MLSDEDIDDELFQSGSVVWAKVADRPWWPCVVFKSWDDLSRWGIASEPPVDRRKEPIASHETIGVLLEDYACEVFDKRRFMIQDWDYISPETVLLETRGQQLLYRRLKRAITDARVLVDVSLAATTASDETHADKLLSCCAQSSSCDATFEDRYLFDEAVDIECGRWAVDSAALVSVSRGELPANKITPRSRSAESRRSVDEKGEVAGRARSSDDSDEPPSNVSDDIPFRRFDDHLPPEFAGADFVGAPNLVSLSSSPNHSPRKAGFQDERRCFSRDFDDDDDDAFFRTADRPDDTAPHAKRPRHMDEAERYALDLERDLLVAGSDVA